MELEVDKQRLANITEATDQRKKERESNFAPKKKAAKKGKTFGSVLSNSEKYKQMVMISSPISPLLTPLIG